ncbi:cysteine hydrolase, partial [Dehalococcoidia bacterium]|nr:cysteine hydrolase [Dehalococcoidia bacterium]
PHPSDLVSQRAYGMSAFHESGLDDELRSMGTKTLVITGVSLNIAITGAIIEAVNRGYLAVLPTDCAASDPPEYAEWIM